MKRTKPVTLTVAQFAKAHGLTIEVKERTRDTINCPWVGKSGRYYAHCPHVEIREGCFLTSAFGNGATPAAAIKRYARELSEKVLVVDAWGKTEREIVAPKLTA